MATENETALLRRVQMQLTEAGARVFRNQVGRYQLKDGRWISSGLCPGSADLIGWTKQGLFLAVEVKTDNGKLSEVQKNFLEIVRMSGGISFVATPDKDTVLLLNSALAIRR